MKNSLIIIIILFSSCYKREFHEYESMTVSYVDIEKYMGKWYVIAHIPTSIEKGATNATEFYEIDKDNQIKTTFTFYQDSTNGLKKEYNPKAYIYNKNTNSEWRMQFFWPIKLPYLIIDLDEDYSYTMVGVPNKNHVWIMSRKPFMDNHLYAELINKLHNIGYNINKIKKIPQIW